MRKKLFPYLTGTALGTLVSAPTTYVISTKKQPTNPDEELMRSKQHDLIDLEIKRLKHEIFEQERQTNCRMYIRMSMNDENIKKYCKKSVQNIGGDSYSE